MIDPVSGVPVHHAGPVGHKKCQFSQNTNKSYRVYQRADVLIDVFVHNGLRNHVVGAKVVDLYV